MENYREVVIASKFVREQAGKEQPCRALSTRPADIRNVTAVEKYKCLVQLQPEEARAGDTRDSDEPSGDEFYTDEEQFGAGEVAASTYDAALLMVKNERKE